MKVPEMYSKKLLKKAQPSLVAERFSGKLKEYGWMVRFLRWVLRKEPEYEYGYEVFSLPKKKNDTIKFRRYSVIPADDV